MAETQLVLHRGAREVLLPELEAVETPPSTKTWHPLPHSRVLATTVATLEGAGFNVSRTRLALSPDGARFFGTLDLASAVVEGVSLAVGIRNSHDQTFPIAMAAGSRVFVCDNLSFHSQVQISRRHTRFGEARFNEGIAQAVLTLGQYQEAEATRIAQYRSTELSEETADAMILRSYERGIISTRTLPDVIREWREPRHEEFRPRTAWSLLNAFTEAIKEVQASNPAKAAATTITLQKLLGENRYGIAQAT